MPTPDDNWYHVGHPVPDEEVLDRAARGLPSYLPTDPRSMDQTPYLAFAERDRTPTYQQEEAR